MLNTARKFNLNPARFFSSKSILQNDAIVTLSLNSATLKKLDAAKIVNPAELLLNRIEKFIPKKTDPKVISNILRELGLDTLKTKEKNVENFFSIAQMTSADTSALINKIKETLLKIAPIKQLLIYLQDKISDHEIEQFAETLIIQTHLLYLFEAITVSLVNSQYLAEDIYSHLLAQRGSPYPGNPLANFFLGVRYQASMFERLKIISIDPGMIKLARSKSTAEKNENMEDVKQFDDKYQLSWFNYGTQPAQYVVKENNTLPGSLGFNILEAAWEDARHADYHNGHLDNAIAAFGLIGMLEYHQYDIQFQVKSHTMPEFVVTNDDDSYELLPDLKISPQPVKVSKTNIPFEWRDLYTSWNLQFVIANVDTVFLPIKLLIPSVLSAVSENYIESRVFSLFTMANLYFNREVNNNPFFGKQIHLSNAKEIFAKWGQINREYAELLFKTNCPSVSKKPSDLYYETLGNQPTLNFFRKAAAFVYDQDKFSVTSLKEKSDAPTFGNR